MKKTTIIALIAWILIIAFVGVSLYFGEKPVVEKDLPQIATLNIEGKTIEGMTIQIYKDYVDLPFVEMLKAFGADVNWLDGDIAEINYNGKEYILDLWEFSFMGEYEGEYINIFEMPYGTGVYRWVRDKEVIFDISSIRMFMNAMDIEFYLDIDYDNSIVYITKVE